MYVGRTYEELLAEALAAFPDTMDKREGSIIYDSVAPFCKQIAKLYIDLENMFSLVFLSSASGSYLDEWGWQTGLPRNPARSAIYSIVFDGAIPNAGERFFNNETGLYFTLRIDSDGTLVLEADDTGLKTNAVPVGSAAVPVNNIRGLKEAKFSGLIEPGTDSESDDAYRNRIHEKLAGPAANNNRQHYKTWCESVQGVGRAKIIPLFAGANTVMAVLFDTEGKPASDAVVERVQEYIDPRTLDYFTEYQGRKVPLGDGLGNGVSDIGAYFSAVPALEKRIDISVSIDPTRGYSIEQATDGIRAAVGEYFRNLALQGMDSDNVIVRVAEIGAIIITLPSVTDYEDLTLNGEHSSVRIESMDAPVLGEVVITNADLSRR